MELSGQFPVRFLCEVLSINRSGFYKWKKRLEHPFNRMKSFISDLVIFKEYHAKYPSHGYRCDHPEIVRIYTLGSHTDYGCMKCGLTHTSKEIFGKTGLERYK